MNKNIESPKRACNQCGRIYPLTRMLLINKRWFCTMEHYKLFNKWRKTDAVSDKPVPRSAGFYDKG